MKRNYAVSNSPWIHLFFVAFFIRFFCAKHAFSVHIFMCLQSGDMFTEEQNELIESAAEMLYGLIHVRYILTSKGMAAMVRLCISLSLLILSSAVLHAQVHDTYSKPLQLDKYKSYDFGRCPRVYCCGQPCLPVGQSDIPRSSTVKIYCPKCEDIYYPRSKYQGSILAN